MVVGGDPLPPNECPKCGKKGIRGTKPHRCHWTTKPKSTSSALANTRQEKMININLQMWAKRPEPHEYWSPPK